MDCQKGRKTERQKSSKADEWKGRKAIKQMNEKSEKEKDTMTKRLKTLNKFNLSVLHF